MDDGGTFWEIFVLFFIKGLVKKCRVIFTANFISFQLIFIEGFKV